MMRRFGRGRILLAVGVVVAAWVPAAAGVLIALVAELPAEPVPGTFLSPAPPSLQARFDDIGLVVALLYAPLAAVLILRRPQPVAWIVAVHAIGSGLAGFGVQYGRLGEVVDGLPLWGLLAYAGGWGFVAGTFLTAIIPLLLLPGGPGALGRVLIAVGTGAALIATAAAVSNPGTGEPTNPLAFTGAATFAEAAAVYAVAAATALTVSAIAIVVLAVRIRRSQAWRAFVWLLVGQVFLTLSYAATVAPGPELPEVALQFGMVAPIVGQVFYPAAILVIALDRELRGIESTVTRILVDAIVVALALTLYFPGVAIAELAAGGAHGAGSPAGGTVTATGFVVAAAIALVVLPLRRVVARLIDTIVYGPGGDPATLVSEIGERVGDIGTGPEGVQRLAEGLRRALRLEGVRIEPSSPRLPSAQSGTIGSAHDERALGAEVGRMLASGADGQPPRSAGRALDELAPIVGAVVRAADTAVDREQARRELFSRRHQERRALRRELHDGIGPALSGIAFQLTGAANLLDRGLRAEADRMIEVIDELLGGVEAEVMALTRHDAVPDEVDDVDHSMRSLVASFGGATPAPVARIAVGVVIADARVRRAVVRIAAEALHNAVRHARASSITVELSEADRAVVLQVVDDGHGLDTAGVSPGTGLHSMREWADSVGATLTFERASEGGTRVIARFPLSDESSLLGKAPIHDVASTIT